MPEETPKEDYSGNRGVINLGPDPGLLVAQAAKERQREVAKAVRSTRKTEREKAAAAAAKTAVTTAGTVGGTSTEEGELTYHNASAPNITIHNSPSFDPYFEAPIYNNSPNIVNSPDMGGSGSGAGGEGGRGGDREPNGGDNRDPNRDIDRDDDEKQKKIDEMTKQLEDLHKKIEELEEAAKKRDERIKELEEKNKELEKRAEEAEKRAKEAEEELERLKNPPPPDFDFERFERSKDKLEGARDRLARVDILRSGRSNDRLTKRRKEDSREYDDALKEYMTALAEVNQLIIEHERMLGLSDKDIDRHLLQMKFAEDEKYAERCVEINNENIDNIPGWRGNVARGLRRVANWPTWAKVSGGLVIGAGVGIASATTGGGLALLVAGGAARFSWALTNHQASLRNVSQHSLEKELEKISQDRREALRRSGGASGDSLSNDLLGATEEGRSKKTEKRQRRNGIATAAMVGGGVLTLVGIGHAIGEDIPSFSVGGWLHLHKPNFDYPFDGGGVHHHINPNNIPPHHPATAAGGSFPHQTTGGGPISLGGPHLEGSPQIDMSHFHPDEFKAKTPHDAVRGMFHVFEKNHIRVRGDNNKAIAAIINDMKDHHWHIASGMADHTGHQNIVDVSQDWADGHTQNFQASAEQGLRKINGSSVENWHKFMELAQRHGVKFIQRSR